MDITRRKFLKSTGTAGSAFLFSNISALATAQTQRIGGYAFGSFWTVLLEANVDTRQIKPKIKKLLKSINLSMSPYMTDSEISRFNAMQKNETIVPSTHLGHVSLAALEMANFTNGAFDPTVGPKVHAAGFGPITGARNAAWLDIVAKDGLLGKTSNGATLDLCGIAKGYALDMIRGTLQKNDIQNAFIEVGGEVAAIGSHPEGRHWRAAIESPHPSSRDAVCIIEPKSLRLASSGHRANGIRGSIETSHIIPKNQMSASANNTLGVSVLAKSAMHADATATALCAMQTAEAIAFAESREIHALFVTQSHGTYGVVATGQFNDHVIG